MEVVTTNSYNRRIIDDNKGCNMNTTKEIKVMIENRLQTVIIAVDDDRRGNHYYVECITETGFDLCNQQYGYFKAYYPMNTRLRSESSKQNEVNELVEAFETAIQVQAPNILLTATEVVIKVSGTKFYSDNRNIQFGECMNIKSKQSGLSISWYEHDVYNQGELTILLYRKTDGQLAMEADENQLYSTEKVKALVESDNFKNKKYAFFCYNEALRLAGISNLIDGSMSGLFATK